MGYIELGTSVAMSADGSTIAAGSPGAWVAGAAPGAVYVFSKGAGWVSGTQVAKLTASDGVTNQGLGSPLALSADGSTIAAGAPTWDLYFFSKGTGWANRTESARLGQSDFSSIALSADGSILAMGVEDATVGGTQYAGAVYVFSDNGQCGSANGGTFTSAPTSNLCTVGTASAVTGTGPWTWTCAGSYGGSTASCSANISTYTVTPSAGSNGSISPNTQQTVNYGSTTSFTIAPNTGYTATVGGTCGGSPSSGTTSFTYTTNPVTANCTVVATFTVTPVPVNGQCGSASGGTFTSAPTTNLCTAGTASALTGTGPWTWSCTGANGGSTASCSANISTYTVTPSAGSNGSISPNTPQTVNYGSTKSFTVTPNTGYSATVGGTCGGSPSSGTAQFTYTTNPVTANCTVAVTFAAIVNGQCGSANGGTFTSAPSSNLCTAGTASSVTGTGLWTWTCQGIYGGTDANCSAWQPNIQTSTLSITKPGTGTGTVTGSGISCGTDCSQTFISGTAVTLTATPASGSYFTQWSGCDTASGTSCTVTMNHNRSVTVLFTAIGSAAGAVLLGDYGSDGIWVYNGSTWGQIATADPESMVKAGSVWYVHCGGDGIWKWDDTWTQITHSNPDMMVVSGSTLYGHFGTDGIWVYNGSGWTQITKSNPDMMVVSGSTLYGHFGTDGIWVYNGSGWTQITKSNPENMVAQ